MNRFLDVRDVKPPGFGAPGFFWTFQLSSDPNEEDLDDSLQVSGDSCDDSCSPEHATTRDKKNWTKSPRAPIAPKTARSEAVRLADPTRLLESERQSNGLTEEENTMRQTERSKQTRYCAAGTARQALPAIHFGP